MDRTAQKAMTSIQSDAQPIPPSGGSPASNKTASSPTQTSKSFFATTRKDEAYNLGSPRLPAAASNIGNGLQSPPRSPRSPRSPPFTYFDQPKSPRDRLEELIEREGFAKDGHYDIGSRDEPPTELAGAPAKASSFHQLRNVSSPIPQTKSLGNSPPTSPARTASTPFIGTTIRPELRVMPRTSSIDSAISTISSTTSHSHKSSQDSVGSSNADIAYLINTAGSPEAVIRHLLKEKQYSAAQNSQLWRLVDKQRTLVLGLNQDLERALKDKERYRKKLKEQMAQAPPLPKLPHSADPSDGERGSRSPMKDFIGNTTSRQCSSERDVAVLEIPTNHENDLRFSNTNNEAVADTGASSSTETRSPMVTACGSRTTPNAITSSRAITPIQTSNLNDRQAPDGLQDNRSQNFDAEDVASPSSFTAKRAQSITSKSASNPSFRFTESTPTSSANERPFPPSRKLPPAPLDLRPSAHGSAVSQYGPDDHSGSDYEEAVEIDESPALERGRKKTREEDDREREAALLEEQKNRNHSKKSKGSEAPAGAGKFVPAEANPSKMPAVIKSVSPEITTVERTIDGAVSAPLAGLLSPSDVESSRTKPSTLAALPMSPGLPISPRPSDRPLKSPNPRMPKEVANLGRTSPPNTPRNAFAGLPLSPRAPRQPIPLPPHTPMSIASPVPAGTNLPTERSFETHEVKKITDLIYQPENNLDNTLGGGTKPAIQISKERGIFRGFISDSHPDLLIPPNALPSIIIKVNSSRLKPSRHSYLVHKGTEEEPVLTLGISARSDMRELWQVEKPLQSLAHLDQQMRRTTALEARLPDRSLFNGHAPAKIDARRVALEQYFENVLDNPMDEKAAIVLCRYLSTQTIEPTGDEAAMNSLNANPNSPVRIGSDGRLAKEGYLTKRGKNFGGWKARYFVLNEQTLQYFDSPGGPLLGVIKLQNSDIGRQSSHHSSHSPSRGVDDADNQYRHAFLIREPKRKDSSSYIRHVLCAESDAERDVWVQALLHHREGRAGDDKGRPSLISAGSSSSKPFKKQAAKKDGAATESPESDVFEGLQTISYEDTVPAQAPAASMPLQKVEAEVLPPSPSSGRASQTSKVISGPSNGAKISDAGAWGNKPSHPKDVKEPKKRGIWGFRDRNADLAAHSADDARMSIIGTASHEPVASVKPCFGIPLAEAVELSPPPAINACLPAVVYRCLKYLEVQDAASEEGIFRLSGSSVVIKGLRDQFNTQGDVDFLVDGQFYDVHAVAGLLKQYLRELPYSILTSELNKDFIAVLELESKSEKVAAYNALVHRLPEPNWALIRALSAFLIEIVNNSNINKMSVKNVSIVFSPTLKLAPPVISMFLTEFDAIFGQDPIETLSVRVEVTANEPLRSEYLHSPRYEKFSDKAAPFFAQSSFAQSRSNEQVSTSSHTADGVGFKHLQPAFSGQIVPGPESSITSRNLALDGGVKARRRESSMLLL